MNAGCSVIEASSWCIAGRTRWAGICRLLRLAGHARPARWARAAASSWTEEPPDVDGA
ncbi:hypothetical protein [Micromonospora sp. NPDC048887]|uniref:hypothetical protein n=1 Tax=Micromonospora sp. NPDC048887 TaxID=3155614 RepID=UPI0033D98C1A